MKCSRCNKELTENQSYVYQGKVMCEDCLMDVGLSLKECDPWATYVDTSARKRHGLTGTAGLTETEAKVYDFVKAKGKVTREQVMRNFGLSEADLKAQLVTLMHAELVKERAERGKMYLVPIS
jgi:late competence protein required for DNA uptake (superfamily II DNA/RNA helicase)